MAQQAELLPGTLVQELAAVGGGAIGRQDGGRHVERRSGRADIAPGPQRKRAGLE